MPGRIWIGANSRRVDHATANRDKEQMEALRSAGLDSAFAFAIHHQGEVVGVVELLGHSQRARHDLREDEADLLGQQLGLFIWQQKNDALHQFAGRDLLEDKLREAERHFRLVFTHTPLPSLIATSIDGHVLEVNEAFSKLTGFAGEHVIGRSLVEVDLWDSATVRQLSEEAAEKNGALRNRGALLNTEDGSLREVLLFVQGVELDGEDCVLVQFQDVTARKRLEQDLRLAGRAIESAADTVIITDGDQHIQFANRAFTRSTGYTNEDVQGSNPYELLLQPVSDNPAELLEDLTVTLADRSQWQGEAWARRKDGEIYRETLSISAVHGDDGRPSHYVWVGNGVGDQHRQKERIEFLAYHDPLTGLISQPLVLDRCEHALNRAHRQGDQVAVLQLGLARFREITDTFGPLTGDALIRLVAQRLTSTLRKSDTVGRLGGTGFVVVLDDVKNVTGIRQVAEKLLEALAQPFLVEQGEVTVSINIGIALYPAHANDAATLLANAGSALEEAQHEGVNLYRVFAKDKSLDY